MAKKHLKEFNPWPAFVDILSSTILVLLLFLLVLLVNLGYQMQFKYRVSYTGSVAVSDLVNNVSKDKEEEKKEMITAKEQTLEAKLKEATTEIATNVSINDKKELDSPGVTIEKMEDKNKKQIIERTSKELKITFKENENFIDDEGIKNLKSFIEERKGEEITILGIDGNKNLSLSVAKQITLARIVSTKNLIVAQKYDKTKIKIKFDKDDIKSENGIIIIKVGEK